MERGASGESEARLASRLLVSFQYVHVQLAGGAPWGFTLKGGLEHGEPLIVSKVEDGGKAALSQKMRPGDELVNINGTPLYGSRQEALILIKGSYRTLKMIIRRRNVPVIRPHSWHLAKLSEVRTEATTMHFPPDAFSLSWHSGCDTSDLPLPWTPLSRHCSSTDKSSSLGSMESLDRSSQTYYEGSLSPIDHAMYHSKRDSAYSSFSASSNTSDSAVRPEESGPAEGGQLAEPRYLQTGGEAGRQPPDAAVLPPPAGPLSPGPGPGSCALESPSEKACSPPQPPVRQDSLQACSPPPARPEARRALPLADSLHPKGRWTSDTSLCARSRDPGGPGGPSADAGRAKESLATEQYYLLSSHMDPHPPMEKGEPSVEPLLSEESKGTPPEEPRPCTDSSDLEARSRRVCPLPWKPCWSGPLGHRHSAPEQLLAAQLQALHVAPGLEGPLWTVSPLHKEQAGARALEPWQDRDRPCRSTSAQARELDPGPAGEEGPRPPLGGPIALGRPRSASVELGSSLSLQPPGDAGSGLQEPPRTGPSPDVEGSRPATRKGGLPQHRSAQMRRRSDRFATNLRNEIQWRKAQLQKGKGSAMLLCGEEPVQETEEPPDSPTAPAALPPPPPPPLPPSSVESKPHGWASPRSRPPKRWGSELSVLGGGGAPPGPSKAALEPQRPQRGLPLPPGGAGGGGRWRWSPEHKLQPHGPNPQQQPAEARPPSRPLEESGLLPFADRRRFFEETSRPPSPVRLSPQHSRPGALRPPRVAEHNAFQPVSPERRDPRRHSVGQPCSPPASPLAAYPDFQAEAPGGFYQPLARHGDWECWRAPPCSCAPRDACAFCCGERCPTVLRRNMPAPSSHCAHHCHPRPWARCGDCCYPAQHQLLEEGGVGVGGVPWQGRKASPPELPGDVWEPPAISRKSSQLLSAHHKVGFARVGPFWPCYEKPAWAPLYRAASTHNLSWECERPGRTAESPAYEEGSGEPCKRPLRERAYSESHLCAEPAGIPRRERRETPLAEVEEAGPELPSAAKKKGPPPPRPPPPNWEKYRPRRASHHQLLPSEAGLSTLPAGSRAPGQSSAEAMRQRSQSLPLEQLWGEPAQQSGHQPRDSSSLLEQAGRHYYCQRSPCRTPEWPTPDSSDRSGSSRPASSLEEEAKPEPSWEKDQPGAPGRTSEQPPARSSSPPAAECGPPAPKGPEGGSRPAGPAPPSRLNSEELMRDVAGRDRSLAGVLSPALGPVTAAEVMDQLFSPGEGPEWKEQPWQPQAAGKGLPAREQTQPASPTAGGAISPTSCSAYYNTSAGKAELLNRMKELPESAGASSEEEELDQELARKKVQLIESISQKLVVLREAQRGLQDDMGANVALGKEVENHVKGVCKPHEFEKFRLFIGDLDKVVNLLLSLSGRLARVENALGGLDSDAPEEEKLALLEKKRQLTVQLEDAKELQEHVARRERLVFASVSHCLPSEQLQDYQHFVRMKSALAIQQRQLDDKVKLGEEQLRCLRESLRRHPTDC
ncbi:protein Shroom4 isoform X2 [Hemicordylus capensis]|uniref:protein Shroom4 isoform X2 n=1 Tax=Hemicordylus capensis TaxID=884348 RepID=UPI0023027C83|nr:protein Shroom4 isoform X2 [Hemicordylus capensis]